jgi:hypothetical protein
MPDRTYPQVTLTRAEHRLYIRQLHICLPELLSRPAPKIRPKKITTASSQRGQSNGPLLRFSLEAILQKDANSRLHFKSQVI